MNKDDRLRTMVTQRLETLSRAGVGALGQPREPASGPKEPVPGVQPSKGPATSASDTKPDPAGGDRQPAGDVAAALDQLRERVAGCTLCQQLAQTRTQTVFGVGDPAARICFVGEAPGAEEDRRGEPFVGAAGKLLTRIIEACQLQRNDVYILNVLKCRPPGNRNPAQDEVANCRPFLDAQLDLVQPEMICCLGSIAAQTLLETSTPIGRLRGRLHDYRGTQVVCTYHPAYLLRNPAAKQHVWDDMKMMMGVLGVQLD